MQIVRLADLGKPKVLLSAPCKFSVESSLTYENVTDFDTSFGLHLNKDVYSRRDIDMSAIEMVRLGEATLYANKDFMVRVDDSCVLEQVPPWVDADRFPDDFFGSVQTEVVMAPTVVIARFGAGTWGHWIGELLPKIVLIEAAFPFQFRYAVPEAYLSPGWGSFKQSLEAYGIRGERLIPLKSDRAYRLRDACCVTPIWSDHLMHPAACERMRCGFGIPMPIKSGRRVALARRQEHARRLENWDRLASLLTQEGFEIVDIGSLDFRAQVQTFSESDVVVSTLGSGLTGLIYSPPGVLVLSLAPYLFGDRFFYAMIVDRRGRYVDLRGPIEEMDEAIPHRSSFTISPDRLMHGLSLLGATAAQRLA